MTSREQLARSVFVNMPDEVFDLYIVPLIKFLGWTYSSKDAVVSSGWQQAFDNNQLQTIAGLQWERGETNYLAMTFHPNSADNLNWIQQAHLDGVRTPCSNVLNGKQRFESSLAYIQQTGKLPKPVMLMKSHLGYRILDGNHRLAAALAVSWSIDTRVSYWLGSTSSSNPWSFKCR